MSKLYNIGQNVKVFFGNPRTNREHYITYATVVDFYPNDVSVVYLVDTGYKLDIAYQNDETEVDAERFFSDLVCYQHRQYGREVEGIILSRDDALVSLGYRRI